MSLDNVSYYDFDSEIKVKNWTPVSIGEDSFSFRSEFEASAGEYLLFLRLAFGVVDAPRIVFRKITLNGSTFDSAAAPAVYTAKGGGSRKGIEVTLQEGANTIEIEGIGPTAYINDFMNIAVSFGKPQTKVAPTAKFHAEFVLPEPVFPEPGKVLLPGGFTPGIGCTESPGRFGFSKGDGVLDCAMPTLGCIDKMYMCGHPQYQKPFRWNYSTLPEGAPHHGTYVPANTGIDGDEVKINHLSVRWTTEFIDEKFACTYSLASPGIITERESGSMRISGLEFAGNYQYAMLPRANSKIEVTSLRDIADIRLGANWMLLFGCTEFPDIPLLLVFQKQPENMRLKFSERTGRLAEIAFENCPLLISATPFGFESFQPIPPEDSAFLHRAAVRCRFWSRAFLAYPVRCEEYFKNDYAAKKTTILQKFSYRYIADAWGTAPLELAPIPPAAQLSGLLETTDQVDFEFPTKYGNLTGAFGNQSSYALPFMPSARKFPLKDKSSDALKKLLEDGLDSYFDFVTSFPDTFQAYPYAGSLMEPFALTTSLLFFMDESHRERLRTLVGERLEKACDPERDYNYAVINHGFMMKTAPDDEQLKKIYADPAMAYKRLWNWYLRSEPFTGIKFHICYLNVCFLSSGAIKDGTPEEIAALKIPLIENDWGVGLAFYYMHLCALASGDFAPMRKNWPLLKSVYSFFEKMHDWACLGTGYSDNAILWVEGANYGAFTSFIQMAEAVGDRETMEKAQYMAAKQFALRMAIVRSARQHFCKYYKVEPWDITRIFTEEMNPQWQYQGVPHHLGKKRFRSEGVYTLTTEGMYPEFFEGLRQFLPDEAKTIMTKLGSWLHEDAADSVKHSWSDMQKTACYLIDLALDENASSEKLKEEIAFAKSIGLLMTKWRGIHIFSRRLPEHYFETQLLAWDAMKEHPVWLEYWYGLKIESAEWDGKFAEISFQTTDSNAVLRFGIRKKPLTVTENGERLHLKADEKTIEIHPRKSGTILLEFDAPIFGCGQNKLELTSTTHTGGNSFAKNKLFSIRNTGVSNMIQFPQWGCFLIFTRCRAARR